MSILGLRLGALLALRACSRGLAATDLILWDPVVDGAKLLDEMRDLHARVLKDTLRWSPEPHIRLRRWWTLRHAKDKSVDEELLAFPWSRTCVSQLQAMNALSPSEYGSVHRLTAFTSEGSPDYAPLRQLRASSGPLSMIRVADASGWNDHNAFEEALLADPIPHAIVKHLTGEEK